MAYLLEKGKIVQQNLGYAHDLLVKIAEKKNPRAMNNLGVLYFTRTDFFVKKLGERNLDKKAFELFKEASEQGYFKAYTNLGICYEKGRGAPKDMEKARQCV